MHQQRSLIVTCLLGSLFAVAATAAPSTTDTKFRAAKARGIPNRYIVVLESADPGAEKRGAVRNVEDAKTELEGLYRIETRESWSHALQGFAMIATEEVARHLAQDPRVRSVEQDVRVSVHDALAGPAPYCTTQCLASYDPQFTAGLPNNTRPFPTSPQTITCSNPNPGTLANCIDNWGLDRIDQDLLPRDLSYVFANTGGAPGPTVHAYVIDTGIRSQHRELAGRIGNGINVVTMNGNLEDCSCHHHGTAVASVIGGRTYGVAKGVILHPVKVVDYCANPNGEVASISGYVSALNWIVQNHNPTMGPAVANLSGANVSQFVASNAFSNAIKGVIQDGITFIQSAGNQGNDACGYSMGTHEPTGVPDAIIAGGVTELHVDGPLRNGRWVADYSDHLYGGTQYSYGLCVNRQAGQEPVYCGSNYGSCVTLWAPAQYIVAAGWDGPHPSLSGSYCLITGTSLAAPHVSGVAALYLQNHPTATPQQVKAALVAAAMPNVLQTSGVNSIKTSTGSPNLLLQIVP